jgi:hypothetical protein
MMVSHMVKGLTLNLDPDFWVWVWVTGSGYGYLGLGIWVWVRVSVSRSGCLGMGVWAWVSGSGCLRSALSPAALLVALHDGVGGGPRRPMIGRVRDIRLPLLDLPTNLRQVHTQSS